jgi:hypothetical protein
VAPGERLGLVITDGSALELKNGAVPIALARLVGMVDTPGQGAGLLRWRDDLIDRALAEIADRMGMAWRSRWQARGKAGAQMTYIGLVAEGLPARVPGGAAAPPAGRVMGAEPVGAVAPGWAPGGRGKTAIAVAPAIPAAMARLETERGSWEGRGRPVARRGGIAVGGVGRRRRKGAVPRLSLWGRGKNRDRRSRAGGF